MKTLVLLHFVPFPLPVGACWTLDADGGGDDEGGDDEGGGGRKRSRR